MAKSVYRIKGRLEMASVEQEGKVTIDRGNNTFSVRPLRGRRAYILPLNDVAEMVVQKIIQAEARQEREPRRTLAKRGLLGVSR